MEDKQERPDRTRSPRTPFSPPEQPVSGSKPAERAPRRRPAPPVTFQPPSASAAGDTSGRPTPRQTPRPSSAGVGATPGSADATPESADATPESTGGTPDDPTLNRVATPRKRQSPRKATPVADNGEPPADAVKATRTTAPRKATAKAPAPRTEPATPDTPEPSSPEAAVTPRAGTPRKAAKATRAKVAPAGRRATPPELSAIVSGQLAATGDALELKAEPAHPEPISPEPAVPDTETNAEPATRTEPLPQAESEPAAQAEPTAQAEPAAQAERQPAAQAEPSPPVTDTPAKATRTEAWAQLVADPGHAPELLALAAVQSIGPRAQDWATTIRDRYPTAEPDAVARLATRQFARFGRLATLASAVAGSYAPITLTAAAALTHAELVLHIAAAYGIDPADEARATDLLVLTQVHPTRASADRELAKARQPAYEGDAKRGDAVKRFAWMAAGQARTWTAIRLINRFYPGTSLLAAALTGRATADAVAARAATYYSQESQALGSRV